MTIVKCPRCHQDTELNIANAIDEEGEVFICRACGYTFRYTDKIK